MSTLPFQLPDKQSNQLNTQFFFLTGTEDFTISKAAAAKAAKAAGQKAFIHICKVHGASEHRSSNSTCVECTLERAKQYREANREENPEYFKQHYEANRDSILEQQKQYKESNRAFYLAIDTCQRMGLSQKGLKQRLPYTEQQFREHIESLWLDDMDWLNYGVGKDCWSVDHKIPVSHFIKTGETDIAVINALSNLQPLWHSDNVRKGNSLPEGFH